MSVIDDIKTKNAEDIARRMLWSGSVCYETISTATSLPIETVERLAAEVCQDRTNAFQRLRELLVILHTQTPSESKIRGLLFEAIIIMNRIFYFREPGRGERGDFRSMLADMDGAALYRMMERLPDYGPGPSMISAGMHFMDTIYAEMMRDHYDDLQAHDE